MRCTSPRTVGFQSDGKTLAWSHKQHSKQYATIQVPCGKCLSCRLENARQTAIRCVHEASMHENNCFITLTYNNENLGSNILDYRHFQKFVKDLRYHLMSELLEKLFPRLSQQHQRQLWRSLATDRRKQLYGNIQTSVFCAGEYGDKGRRIHWHALIFNWKPQDALHKYTSDRGDRVFSSDLLNRLWGRGITEFGEVTFASAGYCARYAAKKLVHGPDGSHPFEPISRRSSKNAIGKSWIAKYYKEVFDNGFIVLSDGTTCGIPRYYEKWLKKEQPADWTRYVTQKKSEIILQAINKEEKTSLEEKRVNLKRSGLKGLQIKHDRVRDAILRYNFKQLTKNHKL